MVSRIGRYATAMTVLAFGACGGTPGGGHPTKGSAADTGGSRPAEARTDVRAPPPPVANQGTQLDISHLGVDSGSRDAPVRIVEMSDYGCGYCRKFHLETWPVLDKEFVETGRVEWKFLPFVTGMFRNSDQATTAAECALEQGRDFFEAMNQRLWEDQREWKGSGDAAAVLRGWAAELGLDTHRYESCVSENRRGQRIAAANALTRQLGVHGTPTFFIGGYPPLQGALPTDAFRQVLTLVYRDAVTDSGK
jgi:protein-disulfide isomerase